MKEKLLIVKDFKGTEYKILYKFLGETFVQNESQNRQSKPVDGKEHGQDGSGNHHNKKECPEWGYYLWTTLRHGLVGKGRCSNTLGT